MTNRKRTGQHCRTAGQMLELLESRFLLATWSGTLPGDTLWSASEIQVINGSLVVPVGVTLTIDLGTVVKVSAAGRFDVSGNVVAAGTSGSPIIITSIKADTAGGAASSPAAGDWRQLRVFSGGFDSDYTQVRYAGPVSLAGTTVLDSGSTGVRVNTTSSSLHRNSCGPARPRPSSSRSRSTETTTSPCRC